MPLPSQPNPRLALLRRDVEQILLKPFRSHAWSADIVLEHDHHDSLEVVATKGGRSVRIGVLYSTATDNAHYKSIEQRAEHIFYYGNPYMLDSFARDVKIPVEPLGDFLPLLVALNKEVEPDRSPPRQLAPKPTIRRIREENPLHGILNRLQQFTSVSLAQKLVERRAQNEGVELMPECIASKAEGIAYSMRNALDYITFTPGDKLNKRILGLYYGAIAFAFAEMLASPTGPSDLDEVEGMTKQGHGLFAILDAEGGFANLHVGVLATGFLPQWLAFLGYDTSAFPKRKPRSTGDLRAENAAMSCTLQYLFASIPEIDDLFAEVFGSAPNWIIPVYDLPMNRMPAINGTNKKTDSTYGLFIDRSGLISADRLDSAGWPLAEIQLSENHEGAGKTYRARVDHSGFDLWWDVLPTHSSPFSHRTTMLFPSVGGMREYRTIATATLYALSIMARYMPSAWRRIEGGDEDKYLALVKAALAVWERVLPEQFLASIAGEKIVATQPDSWL
jgi:hypothetical protein